MDLDVPVQVGGEVRAGLVGCAKRETAVDVFVDDGSLHEDLKHVSCTSRRAVLAAEGTHVESRSRRELDDLLLQTRNARLGNTALHEEVGKNARKRADGVAGKEDALWRRLRVLGGERRGAAQPHPTEGGVVVAILPLGELVEHLCSCGDVFEGLPDDAGKRGKLRLEPEKHVGNRGLDFVDKRSARVAVVEDNPLARKSSLVLEHLLEAGETVGVLGNHGSEVLGLFAAEGLRSKLFLLRDDGRRHVGGDDKLFGELAAPGRLLGRGLLLALGRGGGSSSGGFGACEGGDVASVAGVAVSFLDLAIGRLASDSATRLGLAVDLCEDEEIVEIE
mmetsp:Transcript_73850/g.173405  ORF Transcript_73850/g.173405 Transcript_73850/m.173405 type:complete len:334 (-) Transcript_73850:435-1436(-)